MNRNQFVFNFQNVLRGLLLAALLSGAIVAVLPVSTAAAATWYVSTTGSDANTCTSLPTACLHIFAAIDRANPGDTITIAPGTYAENISITKGLTLQGAGAALTIIDGNSLGNVVFVSSDIAGANVNLTGVTIRNGQGTYGGGIFNLNNNGLLTVSDSVISDNTAQSGGGIYSQGFLRLVNVKIHSNSNTAIQRGGGLLSNGNADLINVEVFDNAAQVGGGGISNSGIMTLTNSLIGQTNQAGKGGGIYNLLTTARLTVNNTTINGNSATGGEGGGIYNEGNLIVAGSTITNNQAAGSGGGVYNANAGQLTLSNSLFQNNHASSSGGGLDNESKANLDTATFIGNQTEVSGGALYNGPAGQLTFISSILRNNTAVTAQGGGLRNLGTAVIDNSQIIDNTASSGGGGGIENSPNANLTLNNSRLTGNHALSSLGGAVHNYAKATLSQVKLQDNQANGGGGIYNEASGVLSVRSSSFLTNTAISSGGGGINNQGTLTITQSALAYNVTSQSQGGGIFNTTRANLTNVTMSDNAAPGVSGSGGAIYNQGGSVQITHATLNENLAPAVVNVNLTGTVTVVNSIVAFSTGGNNCNGSINASGNNIDSGTSCNFGGNSLNSTDPLLGPLQDNGGGTPTHILFISSPAVDNASGALCSAIDQRGVTRPQGSGCDIGAYEAIGFTNSTTGEILPGQCITSETNINNNLIIGRVEVGVNATFQPRGDLRVSLYSPNRAVIQLLDYGTGGDGHNLDVLWDDSAPDQVGTENHDPDFPYFDMLRYPEQLLSQLAGVNSRGLWKLEICNAGVNTGQLNRWTLLVPSIGSNPTLFLPLVRR